MHTKTKAFAICLTTIHVCNGCVVFPDMPALPPVRAVDCPPEIRLDMPPAIPKTVRIIIDGDTVEADEGGEQLLRNYAATRKLIKELWHDH